MQVAVTKVIGDGVTVSVATFPRTQQSGRLGSGAGPRVTAITGSRVGGAGGHVGEDAREIEGYRVSNS